MELFDAASRIPVNAKVYTYADYRNHAAPKGGFVEVYFKAFEKDHKRCYDAMVRKNQKEIYGGPTSSDVCRMNNDYNKEMRRTIDRSIHYYLHDGGVIEAFPCPIISFDLSIKTTASRYNSDYDDYDKHTYSDSYAIIFDPFGSDWRTESQRPKAGPRKFRYEPFYLENKYDRILFEKECLELRLSELRYDRSTFLTRLLPSARKENERQRLEVQKEYDALAAQYDFDEVEKKAKTYWKEFECFAKQVYQAWYESTKHADNGSK